MKKIIFFLFVFLITSLSYAIGFEVSIGVWNQTPAGDISYKGSSGNDNISLNNDLKYGDELRFMGRLKIDMPLFIPNVYLMAAPMQFEGNGSKVSQFKFGDKTFKDTVPFYSKIVLNTYDIGFYYGVPLIKIATMGMLNVDAGLNARIIDFSAQINQGTTNNYQEENLKIPVPMLYVEAQFEPVKYLGFEAEIRGISYSGNSLYSLIGRVKAKMYGFFIAGGYRYDSLKIDVSDVKTDVAFKGSFLEAGYQF